MRWTTRLRFRGAVAALAGGLLPAGCHEFPNVLVDDLPHSSMVTTASKDAALRAEDEIEGEAEAVRVRDFAVGRVERADGTVSHGPLWFEDPFEMTGSHDGQFRVTMEEFLYFPYGIGRFVVNLGLLPLSVLVDPPGSMVCSDGLERRSRVSWLPEPYDAERCSGTTIPLDVHEVWTAGEDAELESPRPADLATPSGEAQR